MNIAEAIKDIRCMRYNECDLPNCHGIMKQKKGKWSQKNDDGKEGVIIMYGCSKCGRLYSRTLKLDREVKQLQSHWDEEQSKMVQEKREIIAMERENGIKHEPDRWG